MREEAAMSQGAGRGSGEGGAMRDEQIDRLIASLERIASVLEQVFDGDKKAIRTNDVGREKVYATHLGKKLSDVQTSEKG